MKDSWVIGILAAGSLIFALALLSPYKERVLSGVNDFAPLYAGPILADTGDLYDREKLHEIEREILGTHIPSHGYIRLPFYALLLKPLSLLPYRWAYSVWTAASLAAFAAFLWLWRPPGGQINILFGAMCLPVFAGVANGQDVTFLLLLVTLAHRWKIQGRTFLAGAVFSLCSIKFHLFFLTPLLIAGQRSWGFARGLLAGGAALAGASFLAGGWSWPLEFFRSATDPAFTPAVEAVPNLHGAVDQLGGSRVFETALTLSAAAAVWLVCRRASFEYSLGAMLAGSLLASYHSYLPDMALFLPAGLILVSKTRLAPLRILAAVLLSLPAYLALLLGYPSSLAVVGALLALVYLAAYEAVRKTPGKAAEPSPVTAKS